MTNPRRMRRTARKMRRYGMQPMVVMNASDPLPDIIIVTLARFLWRYRSELAPLTTAGLTWITAWICHATHTAWWPALAGTTAALAVVSLTGERLGLATRAERAYAMAVIAAAGGWLAAATASGPAHGPLPRVLVLATCVLAAPWWAHRRRRAKVRVERLLAAWPEIAPAVGLAGSRVMSAVVDLWGWRARFALARGQTITDVIAKLPAIESGLGTFRGAARVYPPRRTWPTGSSCGCWTKTRTPTRSPGPAHPPRPSPSPSTSARLRTPRPPPSSCSAGTHFSAGQPDQASPAASTS